MLEECRHNHELGYWDSLVYQAWFNSLWEKMRKNVFFLENDFKKAN